MHRPFGRKPPPRPHQKVIWSLLGTRRTRTAGPEGALCPAGTLRQPGRAGAALTHLLHGRVEREEALSEELLHHLLVVGVDLGDHVAGDEAGAGTGLTAVEAVGVLVSVDLGPREGAEAL